MAAFTTFLKNVQMKVEPTCLYIPQPSTSPTGREPASTITLKRLGSCAKEGRNSTDLINAGVGSYTNMDASDPGSRTWE